MQRVLVGSTDTVFSYPSIRPDGVHLHGSPSNVFVRFGTPSTSLPDESSWVSATAETLSLTVNGAIQEGATEINTPTGTFIKGHKYLVTDAEDYLIVECSMSATGTHLYLTAPLPRALSNQAVVSGWYVSKALTALETQSAGNAISLWKATVNGTVYQWSEPFRIVRRHVVIPLTPPVLTSLYPVVLRLRSRYDGSLDELIAAAWELRVVPALLARGVNEDEIVNSDALRPMLAHACLMHLVSIDETADPQWRDSVLAEYQRLTEATFARVDWHDAPQTVDPPLNPDPTDRRISIRMTR